MSAEISREAAQDLIDDYADLIDSDRLEEWLDLFTEDCIYRVTSRENEDQNLPVSIILCNDKNMLRDRIVSLRNANEYNLHYDRHLVSNVRVRVAADGTPRIEANYAVVQTTLEGRSILFSVGRYRDRVRWVEGRLLITEKLVIMDTFAVPTLLATPL
jgi:anthranilate 1,2-dioxygenase small subunit